MNKVKTITLSKFENYLAQEQMTPTATSKNWHKAQTPFPKLLYGLSGKASTNFIDQAHDQQLTLQFTPPVKTDTKKSKPVPADLKLISYDLNSYCHPYEQNTPVTSSKYDLDHLIYQKRIDLISSNPVLKALDADYQVALLDASDDFATNHYAQFANQDGSFNLQYLADYCQITPYVLVFYQKQKEQYHYYFGLPVHSLNYPRHFESVALVTASPLMPQDILTIPSTCSLNHEIITQSPIYHDPFNSTLFSLNFKLIAPFKYQTKIDEFNSSAEFPLEMLYPALQLVDNRNMAISQKHLNPFLQTAARTFTQKQVPNKHNTGIINNFFYERQLNLLALTVALTIINYGKISLNAQGQAVFQVADKQALSRYLAHRPIADTDLKYFGTKYNLLDAVKENMATAWMTSYNGLGNVIDVFNQICQTVLKSLYLVSACGIDEGKLTDSLQDNSNLNDVAKEKLMYSQYCPQNISFIAQLSYLPHYQGVTTFKFMNSDFDQALPIKFTTQKVKVQKPAVKKKPLLAPTGLHKLLNLISIHHNDHLLIYDQHCLFSLYGTDNIKAIFAKNLTPEKRPNNDYNK